MLPLLPCYVRRPILACSLLSAEFSFVDTEFPRPARAGEIRVFVKGHDSSRVQNVRARVHVGGSTPTASWMRAANERARWQGVFPKPAPWANKGASRGTRSGDKALAKYQPCR